MAYERAGTLVSETVVVGLSAMAVGAGIAAITKLPQRPLLWFGIGAGTHLLWEALGGNRWYVETRNAKEMPKGLLGVVRGSG